MIRHAQKTPGILRLAALIAAGALQASPAAADDAAWHRAPGGLLPLQDRVGMPRIAAAVEDALRQELAAGHALVEPAGLRDAQRRLRLRDASQTPPQALARLGQLSAAGWLFSATLHRASEGRTTRAARDYGDSAPAGVPQIVLTGRAVRLDGGDATLGWAGYEAASGLDDRRLLGLGVVTEPDRLARDVARRLVEAFERGRAGARPGVRPARGGYLRAPIDLGGTIAVVPFHSVTERDATVAGETVTDLTLAVLYRRGAGVMLPGRVNEVLRGRGSLLRGEVDASVRADLRDHGADLIMTGTVETWDAVKRGGEPEPRIGLSARLLDAETGAILWWNGQDRRGWDRSQALGLGRVHASGALAEEVMEALVASFLSPRGGATASLGGTRP